jgi:hypothetical protein
MILIRSRRRLLYLGPRRARSWRHGYGGRLGLPLESYRERNARAQVGGEKILVRNARPCLNEWLNRRKLCCTDSPASLNEGCFPNQLPLPKFRVGSRARNRDDSGPSNQLLLAHRIREPPAPRSPFLTRWKRRSPPPAYGLGVFGRDGTPHSARLSLITRRRTRRLKLLGPSAFSAFASSFCSATTSRSPAAAPVLRDGDRYGSWLAPRAHRAGEWPRRRRAAVARGRSSSCSPPWRLATAAARRRRGGSTSTASASRRRTRRGRRPTRSTTASVS